VPFADKRYAERLPSGRFLPGKSVRVQRELLNRINVIWPVQSCLKKYSDFPKSQISLYPQPSCPTEGRFAIVTDAGQDAVDVDAPITNGAEADGKGVWS
jgi:hypothetical protein